MPSLLLGPASASCCEDITSKYSWPQSELQSSNYGGGDPPRRQRLMDLALTELANSMACACSGQAPVAHILTKSILQTDNRHSASPQRRATQHTLQSCKLEQQGRCKCHI